MTAIMDSHSDNFSRLFGNGLKYIVPPFQRDYSWDYEQWDDLWQDLQLLMNDPAYSHYMGYLVFQTEDMNTFTIIDGQQRLTTLCILILSIINNLKKLEEKGVEKDDNQKRREQLAKAFIGDINYVTLISENKLILNRNNNAFYSHYLVPLQKLPVRGLNSSEKLLKKCFEWFDNKVSAMFKSGQEMALFVDRITRSIYFTIINVSDSVNAFKVFETLNARGVQLSSSDLLKNYLFQIVDNENPHEKEFLDLEELWASVIDKLGSEKFPEFLRLYWNSRHPIVRKANLYKTLKDNIKTKGSVFSVVRELIVNADIYQALIKPEDELWNNYKHIRNMLSVLELFNVSQPFALLLTAYQYLPVEQFENLLSVIITITLRYNIIGGKNPNEQEIVYNRIANEIYRNKNYHYSMFSAVYPNDDEFENDFANKDFKSNTRNNKIVKYILSRIEQTITGAEIEFESEINTLEHILPENPSEDWDFSDEGVERWRYRIGNLTLLEKKLNKDIENKIFVEKQPSYSKSKFTITSMISSEYDNWTEKEIARRQKWLARQAKSLWKINS